MLIDSNLTRESEYLIIEVTVEQLCYILETNKRLCINATLIYKKLSCLRQAHFAQFLKEEGKEEEENGSNEAFPSGSISKAMLPY